MIIISERSAFLHPNTILLIDSQLLDRETRREKVIEAKNREQRLKMRTFKTHGESDLADSSAKADDREDSKDSSSNLRNTLIIQCEQDYENLINAVKKFSVDWSHAIGHILIACYSAGIDPRSGGE